MLQNYWHHWVLLRHKVKKISGVSLLPWGMLFFVTLSCKKNVDIVPIKALLLNPEEYQDKDVRVSGQIIEVGPAGVSFVLSDDSGRMNVLTENYPARLPCSQGQSAVILGKLKQGSFQLTEVVHCGS